MSDGFSQLERRQLLRDFGRETQDVRGSRGGKRKMWGNIRGPQVASEVGVVREETVLRAPERRSDG